MAEKRFEGHDAGADNGAVDFDGGHVGKFGGDVGKVGVCLGAEELRDAEDGDEADPIDNVSQLPCKGKDLSGGQCSQEAEAEQKR
jgi:hypothetical protein